VKALGGVEAQLPQPLRRHDAQIRINSLDKLDGRPLVCWPVNATETDGDVAVWGTVWIPTF